MCDQFRQQFPFGDQRREHYASRFHRLEVPARTVLLEEGEIAKKMFFIEKGCIRVWFNNNGKDMTFQFFFEHDPVSSIESFRKGIPSPVIIETIEPCVLRWAHKEDFDNMMAEAAEDPTYRQQMIDGIFERTFDYMKHFVSFIKDTPTQRYLNLIAERPEIVKRVPQHYIASFLGVSTVHLSRIKSKLAKGGI